MFESTYFDVAFSVFVCLFFFYILQNSKWGLIGEHEVEVTRELKQLTIVTVRKNPDGTNRTIRRRIEYVD